MEVFEGWGVVGGWSWCGNVRCKFRVRGTARGHALLIPFVAFERVWVCGELNDSRGGGGCVGCTLFWVVVVLSLELR